MDFSVLISTRNRAATLAETLQLLQRQQLDGLKGELVVIDNGSSDVTPQVLARIQGPLAMVVLREPRPGKNRALNRAVAAARGRLLIFTDDDVVPVPCWLAELVAGSRRWPEYSVFAGPVVPRYPAGTPSWLEQHAFAAIAFARFVPQRHEAPLGDVSPFGPNYAVRAQCMAGVRFREDIGPAHDGDGRYPLADETELLRRLRAQGKLAVFLPAALVEHRIEQHQLSVDWLFNRSFRAGRAEVCLGPDLEAPRLFDAPRYLWRLLLTHGIRHGMARLASAQTRFETGIALQHVRGQLHEYRTTLRELQATDSANLGSPSDTSG